MKIVFLALMAFALLGSQAYALSQIAGPIEFRIAKGGEGVFQHGILTKESGAITVYFNAEGDAAKYVSFPAQGTVKPNELNNFEVKAKVPENYEGNGLVLGWLFTTQRGDSGGAAQLNIRLARKIVIYVTDEMQEGADYAKMVSDYKLGQTPPAQTQEIKTAQQEQNQEPSGGLVVGGSQNDGNGFPWWIAALVAIGIAALIAMFWIKKHVAVRG